MNDSIHNLIQKAQNGDIEAFGDLFEAFSAELYRYACCVIGSQHLAQDAVQDTALAAFSQLSGLRDISLFKHWIFKILCNICKKYYKANLFIVDSMSVQDETESFDNISLSYELKNALESLTQEERSIVMLKVISGYKSKEIADMLDLNPVTVRSKLKRSLNKMRIQLS